MIVRRRAINDVIVYRLFTSRHTVFLLTFSQITRCLLLCSSLPPSGLKAAGVDRPRYEVRGKTLPDSAKHHATIHAAVAKLFDDVAGLASERVCDTFCNTSLYTRLLRLFAPSFDWNVSVG